MNKKTQQQNKLMKKLSDKHIAERSYEKNEQTDHRIR